VRADAIPQLPLIIGPGAQHQVASLSALLEGQSQLRPLIAGCTWVGGRRWDVRFATGETLSLPEGDDKARAALQKFAEMNTRQRMLGGNFLRFDMRIEGRMIVQLRRTPEGGVPATATVPQGEPPADLSRTI
jgi:cell division protein FtsQ